MKDKRDNKQYLEYGEQTIRLFPELYSAKEGPNGERVMARTVTFQVTDDCNLACFVAGTKILMEDFSYKNIEDIKVGDIVLAFDNNTEKNKQLKLQPTKVTHTFIRHDKVRKIVDEYGDEIITTDEHPFLDGRRQWKRAEKINESTKLQKFYGAHLNKEANIEDENYAIGYIISSFLGDGSMSWFKHGDLREKQSNHTDRLAVKDTEIIKRIIHYLDNMNIKYDLRPFKISEKDNLYTDALYIPKKDQQDFLKNLIIENLNINEDYQYLCGFLAGIIDTEGSVYPDTSIVRIFNSNHNILKQCEFALNKLGYDFTYDKDRKGPNYTVKILRVLSPRNTINTLKLLKEIKNAVYRKSCIPFNKNAFFKRSQVINNERLDNDYHTVYNFETELHTYIANDFAVHNCVYCYQCNKGKRRMSFETAKKFVDYLLDADESNHYINPTISPFIIIDFIGGEPFLEIDLIEKIVNYFNDQCFLRQHPWATRHRFSICSNGVLYFDPRVQEFMHKNRGNISFSVTIDGNKELHDSCRVFPDGSPSYDLAVAAAQDWMNQGNYMGSKITIAPGNVQFLSGALKHMVELGYTEINANCVYEEGWELEHAQELYKQMKIFSDYLIENNLYRDIFCSLYQENFFQPKDPRDNQNWCFGAGTPILTTDGYKPIEKVKIGDMVYTEDGTIHPVINTMSHFANNVIRLDYDDKTLYCTNNHKFFIIDENGKQEKKEIKNLNSNKDYIRTYDYENKTFGKTNNYKIYEACDMTVYNITVETNHSYIANGLVSSNCGGTGLMLACDPDGWIYPCLRYMESSLGDDQPPLRIGHVDRGIETLDNEKEIVKCLNCITRRSQSTDECFYCPIAEGCSYCSAYNYQVFGTADARATFICIMHRARALGNLYYFNKIHIKENEDDRMLCYVPKEWAIPIIGEEEFNKLIEDSGGRLGINPFDEEFRKAQKERESN